MSTDWRTQLLTFYAERLERLRGFGLDESRGIDPTPVYDPFVMEKKEHPIVIIGEAPGGREVEERAPFVGPAGKNLSSLIERSGLDRKTDILITNAFPFRTCQSGSNGVKNRTPETSELTLGAKLLLEELEIIRPSIILVLGGSARKAFMKLADRSLTQALKSMEDHTFLKVASQSGFDVILGRSFHPSPLVYNIPHKREKLQEFFTSLKSLTA